jgi:membrane protein CcdC involved in cytochrome C biogenesis
LFIALISFHLSFNWLVHESNAFNRPLNIKIAFDVIFLGAGALMYWSVPLLRRTQRRILLFIGFVCGISVINHFYGTFSPTHPDLALELILQSILISSVVLWLDDQPTLAAATK